MTQISRPPSLVAQVTETLRRDLQQGVWTDFLPGELSLSDRFQVSRVTVRAALEVLGREGLIEVSQGLRRRITSKARVAARAGPKVVGVISPLAYPTITPAILYVINELQAHLHEAGYKVEVQAHPRFGGRRGTREVHDLISRSQVDVWVAMGDTRWVQCYIPAGTRAIAVGMLRGRSTIPCLGVDYRAICRHAVGLLLSRGHSRLTLLVAGRCEPGANPTERGFREGISAGGERHQAQATVVAHDATIKGIRSCLGALFRPSNRPDGLLVERPKHVLTVMSHLASAGIQLPRDVSLISLSHEPFLDNITPSIAHYEVRWATFARRLFRMVVQFASTGTLAPSQVLMMADFREGETLDKRV